MTPIDTFRDFYLRIDIRFVDFLTFNNIQTRLCRKQKILKVETPIGFTLCLAKAYFRCNLEIA